MPEGEKSSPSSSQPFVLRMLVERGVDRAESVLEAVGADQIEAVLGAIRWYDERKRSGQRVGPGLLVNVLREGGKPGYGEQEGPSTKPVTPRLLASVRGRCLSADGCTREEAMVMFEQAAAMRGLSAEKLVEQAMGPWWARTPVHPALMHAPGRQARYGAWINAEEKDRPDLSVVKARGESEFEFAKRFWRFEDPEEARPF